MTVPKTGPSTRMNPTVASARYTDWIETAKKRCPRFGILDKFHSIEPIDKEERGTLTSSTSSKSTPIRTPARQHQSTPINPSLQQSTPTNSDPSASTLPSCTSSEPASNIFLLHFRDQSLLDIKPVKEQNLDEELKKDEGSQLYVVQDLSPRTLAILGPRWNIDPQFFLDYLDLVPREASTDNKRKVKPTPWYRLGDIDYHLPPLRSTHSDMEHVVIRYIGPIEYRHEDENVAPPYVPDRLNSDVRSAYVERVGGGHNPIYAESTTFWGRLLRTIMETSGAQKQAPEEVSKLWPAAMIRHSIAIWFERESSGQWKRGDAYSILRSASSKLPLTNILP